MCILQPRLLLLALGAVAASALAPQLAAAQRMGRPMMMPAAGMMMSRPMMMNPNAAFMGSMNGFRSPSGMMMASPGMNGGSSFGAGSGGNSSGMGGSGGGMAGSSYGGQGGAYDNGSPEYGGDSGASSATPSEDQGFSRVLTATGIPNDGGRLLWPVGFRVLRVGATDEIRRQIEALLQLEAAQTQTGSVNPRLAKELAGSIDALRTVLLRDRQKHFSLPLTLYGEAESFLARLDHAQKLLEAGLETPRGKVLPEPAKGNADE